MRSEYAANQALQRAEQPTGWLAPSRCIRKRQGAFKRLLRALGVLA
jgi:hypothetical protein